MFMFLFLCMRVRTYAQYTISAAKVRFFCGMSKFLRKKMIFFYILHPKIQIILHFLAKSLVYSKYLL